MNNIGINVAFPPKKCDIVEYYSSIFDLMARRKINFCRLWFTDFSFNFYYFQGKEYSLHMEQLLKIIQRARKNHIMFIPVLFDSNEFSSTNVHWNEYDHTFKNSFIHFFIDKPMDFFSEEYLELGFSKFKRLSRLFSEDVIVGWELFNEVDHVGGFRLPRITDWTKRFVEKARPYTSKSFYLSFANPRQLEKMPSGFNDVIMGIHTYEWPYKDFYKNIIFWQSLYPDKWIMEFGSAKPRRHEILIALLSSYLLNSYHQVAMSWYWDDVMKSDVYDDFFSIINFLEKYGLSKRHFTFIGSLGRADQKVSYKKIENSIRLAGLPSTLSKISKSLLAEVKNIFSRDELVFETNNYLLTIGRDMERSNARPMGYQYLDYKKISEFEVKIYKSI